jgi:very-short-patch-repair endonuclease
MEDAFVELCERFGIPLPEINGSIEGKEVDAVWHAEKVAVELDSELAHGVVGSVHRDRARDLRLRAAGWVVLRYSWWQVVHEPHRVATDLLAALASPNPWQESAGLG